MTLDGLIARLEIIRNECVPTYGKADCDIVIEVGECQYEVPLAEVAVSRKITEKKKDPLIRIKILGPGI